MGKPRRNWIQEERRKTLGDWVAFCLCCGHTLRYFLGDEVFLLVTLPESSERLPVAGKVIWITPTGAQGNRTAGIGVQFTDSAEGETVKGRIETLLAGTLNADKPTNTM